MSVWFAGHPALAKAAAGALSGLIAAAAVDFHAFLTWQKVQDAIQYNWSVALFRWAQGAVAGFVTGLGLYAAS